MSVDEKIRTALLVFGDSVENAVYHGTAKQYYSFNYDTIATDFGDDAPQHERYLVQVHFFAPLNAKITNRIKQTKRALYAAGLTWPDTVNDSDDSGRHIIFECETAEGADIDGND